MCHYATVYNDHALSVSGIDHVIFDQSDCLLQGCNDNILQICKVLSGRGLTWYVAM